MAVVEHHLASQVCPPVSPKTVLASALSSAAPHQSLTCFAPSEYPDSVHFPCVVCAADVWCREYPFGWQSFPMYKMFLICVKCRELYDALKETALEPYLQDGTVSPYDRVVQLGTTEYTLLVDGNSVACRSMQE